MALVLTEEQEMLRDAAKGYLTDNAPVAQLRKLRDDADPSGFSRDTWKAMADMGWTGVLVPEEHGGVGMGHVAAGVIAEEMGRTLTASPFLSSARRLRRSERRMAAQDRGGGGDPRARRRRRPQARAAPDRALR